MPSLQRQVVLRFRAPGHVRFSLPKALCQPDAAERLRAGLKRQAGVTRIELLTRQRKLSIRFAEETIGFKSLAAALSALISETQASLEPERGTGLAASHAGSTMTRARLWADAKAQELKETLAALRIVLQDKLGGKLQASPERSKFLGEFLTDILVLYLIKTHWTLITQQWLKRPWQHRYEWLASLYMIYLLVSSKKPKSS
ncbi:hypothetical protein [Methyloterricola oryzae]|uniref:hypothetical protein n=1 Tax=Methyloterricola oryzae TaxID=1495050 RepID=UPI0005EB8EAA|nr:hypothetical protein [Methyloterricola oryzae]